MTTICATCFIQGKMNILGIVEDADERVSHGICRLHELEVYQDAWMLAPAERVQLLFLRHGNFIFWGLMVFLCAYFWVHIIEWALRGFSFK